MPKTTTVKKRTVRAGRKVAPSTGLRLPDGARTVVKLIGNAPAPDFKFSERQRAQIEAASLPAHVVPAVLMDCLERELNTPLHFGLEDAYHKTPEKQEQRREAAARFSNALARVEKVLGQKKQLLREARLNTREAGTHILALRALVEASAVSRKRYGGQSTARRRAGVIVVEILNRAGIAGTGGGPVTVFAVAMDALSGRPPRAAKRELIAARAQWKIKRVDWTDDIQTPWG